MPPPTILNALPYEVIAAPYNIWWAPVGTAFPLIDADPTSPWALIGLSGSLNYDDSAGVTVAHPQTINKWRSHGDTGSRKAFRTEEDCLIRFTLNDLRLESYRLALNQNAITQAGATLGVSGTKKIGLSRGFGVANVSLLVRGTVSPYLGEGIGQYEIPIVINEGSTEVVYVKGTPAGLALEFSAMVDPNAASADERFGRLLVAETEPGT
jgi:hypothetical protein